MPVSKPNCLVVRAPPRGDHDAGNDQAHDRYHLDRSKPKFELSEGTGSCKIDGPLMVPGQGSRSEAQETQRPTTTISMSPTHMALLQIPFVQAESGCPAGVQYDMMTAAAEISAGRTTFAGKSTIQHAELLELTDIAVLREQSARPRHFKGSDLTYNLLVPI